MNALARLALAAFAALKFSKLFLSAGSMILMVGVYGWLFGWRYAVGFVALLFVHELGHLLAARRRGLAVGLPTFIPFVGAWIQLKQLPHDAETEAFVGLGGPVLGTVGALACWFVARDTDTRWLLALSYSGFFLNLFNLIPVAPFDGGRIMAVLSPRLWLLGVPILVALFAWNHSPIMIVMLVLAAPSFMAAFRWKGPETDAARAYYTASAATRWTYGAYYLLLVLFLAVMVAQTDAQLRDADLYGSPSSQEADDV